MKRLTLIIKEAGRYLSIPGIASFRTPAEIDVSRVKTTTLIQILHSSGVDNYQLISKEANKRKVYTQDDFNLAEKTEKVLDNRLDKMEKMLTTLIHGAGGKKATSSEQITNRLARIEKMVAKRTPIEYKESKDDKSVVEDDVDQFIPDIDIKDMKISGNTTEVAAKRSDKELLDAADLLSNLKNDGGK